MLERLYIKNFALIEELTVVFNENLNVLTGETGAGKSIVIDAVSVLLGGRAQAEYVRTGTDRAVLEGVFYVPAQHPVYRYMEELGLEVEDQSIVLAREISLSGKNACRVNGRTLTLGQYRGVGLLIVDIHGQHDHQSLLNPANHVDILDKFGGTEHLQLRKTVKECFNEWKTAREELDSLLAKEQERLQRIDILTYQLKEIDGAKLKPGEDEELKKEAILLANAEKIIHNVQAAYLNLFGGEKGLSAYDLVSKALANINEVKKVDPSLEKLFAQLETSLYVLEETAGELRKYRDETEFSPQRLEEVEKRLQAIRDLGKKYGPTVKEVLEFREKAQAELAMWQNSVQRAEELESRVRLLREAYEEKAARLSTARKEQAKKLESKVIGELNELAMPDARFFVAITDGEGTSKGLDEVEFLISPNPGEPLLPVVKIASGGELSRIMLALKTITADLDEIVTLIFDEIDAGIGGKAAQKMAEKLKRISKSQQVICVTHSPIIAALADHHLLLEKVVEGGRTKTLLRLLEGEERVDELTRMLGGEKQTDDLRKHALQMLKS
ncbi:MAG: DNA repair protein RecN [Peptococcaceae bacterium]|jgi:DNA repair protein RecN (Recombination protein N)|nr:DNA repair protein RecN [Peptococcaceae bacterium]MDH7525330.1 DNA repair protein RecN [Peptococcaceae bacterium]